MIGGNLTEAPQGYIQLQRQVNSKHTDGSTENYTDYERVYDLIEDLDLESLPEGSRVISLGCRTGYEVRLIGERLRHCRVVGVDIVSAFIVTAEIQDNNPNTEYLVEDLHDLPFQALEFSVVLCVGTLEHCWNVARAASEMKRICQGRLYVTADLSASVGFSDQAASLDPEEWKALFAAPGWTLEREWQEPGSRNNSVLHMLWRRA